MSMQAGWSVDGEDLWERTRSGGAIAIEGFEFQKAYALLRLAWLPTCRRGLVEVRYEGAQDIDLRHGDGRQHFVQAKDYQSGGITLSVLYDVLAGFTRDIISARHRRCSDDALPSFRFVSTTAPIEAEALELYRKVFAPKHVPEIAARIKDTYRKGLDDKAVRACVQDALERTSFEVVLGDHPIEDFRDQASWALAQFGVPVEYVSASLAKIERLLQPRAALQISEVVEALEGLPAGHPGNVSAACRLLPGRRQLQAGKLLKAQFLRGAAESLWSAVANNLAIERADEAEIEHMLTHLPARGGMLLIEGAGGAGKSTMARRVAWHAHHHGAFLVLEVTHPAKVHDAEWAAIVRLCRLSERPLLLVVDDVWRHASFLDGLDRNVCSKLCVLATSRPGERPVTAPTRLQVERLSVRGLGAEELAELAALVGKSWATNEGGPDSSLRRLAEQGQIFALSLVLQNGSLREFATQLIAPLHSNLECLEGFIDLCAAGTHDQAVPVSVLISRQPVSVQFWCDAAYDGLVFPVRHGDTERLRVAHALVAAEVLKAKGVNPVERALSLCTQCAADLADERRFALRLIGNCVSEPAMLPYCRKFAAQICSILARFERASSYSDLHRIENILSQLGYAEHASRVLSSATSERIRDTRDISLALSRGNRHTFGLFFDTILKFYDGDSTVYGRRRFLLSARLWGTPSQQERVADQTAVWLRQHEFPAEETRLLFDLGTYVSDEIAVRIAPVITDYARGPNVSVETLLAAIRLLRRAKCREYFPSLEERITTELAALTTWSQDDMLLARQLTRLTGRWSAQPSKSVLCNILLAMIQQVRGRRLKILLIRSALHLASPEHATRLRSAVGLVAAGHTTRDARNLREHFARRFNDETPSEATEP